MIDYWAALELIGNNALNLSLENIKVSDALNRVLGSDLYAPIDLPSFDNSAVDGFALGSLKSLRMPLVGEVFAKSQKRSQIAKNQSLKIMTGAPVPFGTKAVIMKEEVEVFGEEILLKRLPGLHENIRFMGSDIKKHDLLLKAGALINPQRLGLMLGAGFDEIPVFVQPKVKIIATGDELVEPPKPLEHGQVYHMGPMIKALLSPYTKDVVCEIVPDQKDLIKKAVEKNLKADMILLTGGISLGERDLVKPALEALGVDEIFHKGEWRPGKPLYFGKKGPTLIFGLPGNPVSAFTCFHIFVSHLLKASFKQQHLPNTAILLNDFKKPGMTFFAHGQVLSDGLSIGEQGSHRIFALSRANALCLLPKSCTIVKAGESVKYYPI